MLTFNNWFARDDYKVETIQFADGNALTGTQVSEMAAIYGTMGNDNITGTNGANCIVYGMDGNDKLYAGSGNDTLDGGSGSDTLWRWRRRHHAGWRGLTTIFFTPAAVTQRSCGGWVPATTPSVTAMVWIMT